MTLGENIRRNRKKAGLTQKEVADQLGVQPITISRYEADIRRPSFETLLELAYICGVKLYEMVDRPQVLHEEHSGGLQLFADDPIHKHYEKLNQDGKQEATKRVEELTYIPKYTTKDK